ncbi:MAG: hypothetical protein COB98_01850 [Flavobacteriaceae bacterium]|nr:MAG: hypothetical protein COB98_01850 [Flavobacteriaceae bacterium]
MFARAHRIIIPLDVRWNMGEGMASMFFHDSISKSGRVLHGPLKFKYDSLVSKLQKTQSGSLVFERSNFDDLELLLLEIEDEVILLEKQKTRNTFLFFLLLSVLFSWFIFRKKILFFKKTSLSIARKGKVKLVQENTKSCVHISDETMEILSFLLTKFEKEQGFLEKSMTLTSLAQKLHTNSTYLSKVVNHCKGVNFSAYLNDLRICYIIEQLKLNPMLSHYTCKALAEEAGFKTRESFTKAFCKKVGEPPAMYISKMENTGV